MRLLSKVVAFVALATAALFIAGPAAAQQKLKWAHVYETSEPYHTESVWAAAEIKRRTNGKFDIEVFPASTLGKETDINQAMTLGTVDMIISGPSFAARSYPAARHRLLSVHLPRRRPPDRVFEEPDLRRDGRGIPQEDRHPDHWPTPTTARGRRPPIARSPTARA